MSKSTLKTKSPFDVGSAEAIKLRLRSHLGREWKVGDQLPPVKKLAQWLNAGQNKTYQAVRQLVAEGALVSRRRTGTCVVDPTASFNALRGKTIALIEPPASFSSFARRMVASLVRVLAPTGATMLEMNVTQPLDELPSLVRHCDAAVLLNPPIVGKIPALDRVPVVVASTSWDHDSFDCSTCDLVGVDQVQGGMLAGQHLREMGWSTACFLGRRTSRNGPFDAISVARLTGFERGWGQPLPAIHQLDSGGYSLEGGGRGLRRYLEVSPRPEAVFAISDEVALGFLAAAESHGLEAGRDFQLIGFDRQETGRQVRVGALTTVEAPVELMGRRAGEMLIQRLTEPNLPLARLYMTCRLFAGNTVRRNGPPESPESAPL